MKPFMPTSYDPYSERLPATIQRQEFIDIIDQAIITTEGLTHKQTKALRRVARTTEEVGDNFHTSPACPATQAFGSGAGIFFGPVVHLAFRYDDLIRKHFDVDHRPEVIQVVG